MTGPPRQPIRLDGDSETIAVLGKAETEHELELLIGAHVPSTVLDELDYIRASRASWSAEAGQSAALNLKLVARCVLYLIQSYTLDRVAWKGVSPEPH